MTLEEAIKHAEEVANDYEDMMDDYALDSKKLYKCANEHRQLAAYLRELAERRKQPEIIRCKDCRWWDKCNETYGYCLAAKHGHWSEHWEISIRRVYKEDFYCADAERRIDEGSN